MEPHPIGFEIQPGWKVIAVDPSIKRWENGVLTATGVQYLVVPIDINDERAPRLILNLTPVE